MNMASANQDPFVYDLFVKQARVSKKLTELAQEVSALSAKEKVGQALPFVLCLREDAVPGSYRIMDGCRIRMCTSFNDLASHLTPNIEYLAIHIDSITNCGITVTEWSLMLTTITHLLKFKTPLTKRVIIRKTTPLSIIKQLKKTTVTGILLDISEFDPALCDFAMSQFLHKKPHWPRHIIDHLPGNTKIILDHLNKSVITLTPRQQQVLELLCKRGLTNRLIGNMLSISETTVKIHVGAIMKAYGVKTRTQLIVMAKHQDCNTCPAISCGSHPI